MCGIDKSQLDGQETQSLQRFDKFEGKPEVAESLLKDKHKSHLKKKALQLILDLDHTLLNTTLM